MSLYCSHQSIIIHLSKSHPLQFNSFSPTATRNRICMSFDRPNTIKILRIGVSWKELMLHEIFNSGYYNFLNRLSSEYSTPIWAVLIAGFFIVVSLTLSVYLLFEHLSAYKNPEVNFWGFFVIYVSVFWPFFFGDFMVLLMAGAKVSDWSDSDGTMLCSWISEWCLFYFCLSWTGERVMFDNEMYCGFWW